MATSAVNKKALINKSAGPSDVFRAIEDHDRAATKEIVMRDDVSLGTIDSYSGRSLLYLLLKKVCNGDRIVEDKLNACISTTNQDEDSQDYAVIVDISKLVPEEDRRNLNIIEDLLQLPRRACRTVLHHPVVTSYIQHRWHRTRWVFLVSFLLYLSFTLLFSSYLGMMYWRHGFQTQQIQVNFPKTCDCQLEEIGGKIEEEIGDNASLKTRGGIRNKAREKSSINFLDEDFETKVVVLKTKKNRTRASRASKKLRIFSGCTFRRAFTDLSLCTVEVLLIISIGLLVVQEFWQAIALKKQYFKELENWFELIILSFAISTLCLKQDLDTLKIVSAVGICIVWLELIILFGRYPFLGGMFSIMYYTSTKRVIKTALGFFVMIAGFSFAFFIIHFGNENESFDNIGKSFIKIFVMILGEYEFDDLYESAAEQGDLHLAFTMILLLALIVLGSIVMINLIVATIITDIEWLNHMSKEQVLLNQAHHALTMHLIFSLFPCFSRQIADKHSRNNLQLEYCLHTICACKQPKLKGDMREKVLKILKKE